MIDDINNIDKGVIKVALDIVKSMNHFKVVPNRRDYVQSQQMP